MRTILVFLFLFGCSGWAFTLVPLLMPDNRMQLLRDDPRPNEPQANLPGTWSLHLWLDRNEPPTVIDGLASVRGCWAAKRKIAGMDGREPMAKCRLIEPKKLWSAEP
jgi:hypothetical protein